MGEKRMDPKQQFSKWLARSGAWYWFLFMSNLLVVMTLRPETGESCVWLGLIVSVVMIIHVISYTRNSVTEKLALAMIDRTKLELTLGNKNDDDDDCDGYDEIPEEGESNG